APRTSQLGATGPEIELQLESADAPSIPTRGELDGPSPTIVVAQRYFGPAVGEEPLGGRTMMIRKAFHQVQRRQRRLYLVVVAALTVVAIGAATMAVYGRRQLARQQALAEGFFYDIKIQDVEIAKLEQELA